MDIHHQMIVRSRPARLYQALTRAEDLSAWMAAAALIAPPGPAQTGCLIDFRYGQGPNPGQAEKTLKVEVTRLEANRLVQWRVAQPVWPPYSGGQDQVVTWELSPYETSTLVDFRMRGWAEQDDAYPSVAYKWAGFMFRLKIYLGDLREIEDLLGRMSIGHPPCPD